MENFLQVPVPGQSLTDIPKNSPWENPSELNAVRDVVEYYVNRIADQDIMDDLSIVFELGGDLKTLQTASILTAIPFMCVILLLVFALMKMLKTEAHLDPEWHQDAAKPTNINRADDIAL